jgi:hypothetical protein
MGATNNGLIGLSGAAGSGKDTAGRYLSELLGYQTYALAEPIKAIVNLLMGWDERHSGGHLKEVQAYAEPPSPLTAIKTILLIDKYIEGVVRYRDEAIDAFFTLLDSELQGPLAKTSPRRMYQLVGTEWGRAVDADLWLKLAQKKLLNSKGLIITDVRFPNEAEWVQRQEGYVMRIEREATTVVANHSSENGIPDHLVDFFIPNDGGIGDMEHYLHAVITGFGKHAIQER